MIPAVRRKTPQGQQQHSPFLLSTFWSWTLSAIDTKSFPPLPFPPSIVLTRIQADGILSADLTTRSKRIKDYNCGGVQRDLGCDNNLDS